MLAVTLTPYDLLPSVNPSPPEIAYWPSMLGTPKQACACTTFGPSNTAEQTAAVNTRLMIPLQRKVFMAGGVGVLPRIMQITGKKRAEWHLHANPRKAHSAPIQSLRLPHHRATARPPGRYWNTALP